MNSPQANLDLLVARVQNLKLQCPWRLLNVLLLLSVVSLSGWARSLPDRLSLTSFGWPYRSAGICLEDTGGHVYAR